MDPVVHFEMPGDDMERMKAFYEQAFGWNMEQLGQEMGEYVVVSTSERGEDGFPKKPGMINGGFYKKTADNPFPSVTIGVNDIEQAMQRVKAAGGHVMGEPVDIPGVGLYVAFHDTEGNRVSILQPTSRM